MHRKVPWINLAIAAIASAYWLTSGVTLVHHAVHYNFLSFYSGASLARHGDFHHLYDLSIVSELQKRLLPDTGEPVPFTRPPMYAVMQAPLTLLSIVPAYGVYISLQIAALFGCWALACRKFGADALVYCSLYLPSAYGLMHGQDNVWMLFILIVAFSLAESGMDIAAGTVLALGLIKFNLLLLFPFVLLLQKRWRMLFSFGVFGLAQASLSAILIGKTGLQQYRALLERKDLGVSPIEWTMLNVRALPQNLGSDSWWIVAPLGILVLGLALAACWRAPLWRWFSAAAIGSLLVSPHVYKYDATMLLLPILLAIFWSASRFTRIVAATAVTPIPYLVALLGQPFAAIPAVLLLTLLGALARESYDETRVAQPASQPLLAAT
ncbi:MAG TPA: glycosyltransferase family 87 protein [Bryobacteraceae bacterium]|nr:glycosyltransferase family 87 protein [Bryobacteraceae bacterium]